jgi:cytidylate kinase
MRADETPESKLKRNFVVAIDGPAGAGKSTIARHLARHFGLLNLETGAMYRAFALKALRLDVPLDDPAALERLAAETEIKLEPGEDENRVLLDGEDVTGQIRNQTVTDAASRVSVFPPIRAAMVKRQQEMGAQGGVVMEGRDIGTVVFPNAEVKIFLDAAPEVRGMRRYDQIGQTGPSSHPDAKPMPPPEEVIRDLRARDERDRNRADSPLRPAPDAFLLDSTNLSLEEAVKAAENTVDAWLAKNSSASFQSQQK